MQMNFGLSVGNVGYWGTKRWRNRSCFLVSFLKGTV